jgi:hypothetical protein
MNVNGQVDEDVDEEVTEEDVAEEDDGEFESIGDFISDNEGLVPSRFSLVIYSRFLLCLLLISPFIYSRLSPQYTREEEWKRYQ